MKHFKFLLLFLLFLSFNKVVDAANVEIDVEHMILQDHLTGKILYEKN